MTKSNSPQSLQAALSSRNRPRNRPSLRQGLRDGLEALPMGPAPILVFCLALVSALTLRFVPTTRSQADLVFWTFSPDHHAAYLRVIPEFEAGHPGVTADVLLVHEAAMNQRLSSVFWAQANVPDLVEVENTQTGQYFRGPVDQIGFHDLRPWLEASGLMARIPETRLAPYTHKGRVFGIPHDVHPVMFAYRADLLEPLLEKAGMTIDQLDTWEAFTRFARAYVLPAGHYMLQLEDAAGYNFEPFLYQAGLDYFDEHGEVVFDREEVVQLLMWWLELVAAEDAISVNFGSWGAPFFRGLAEGDYLMVIAPDWRTGSIERNLPELHGKMKLMPLPAFESGGRRTSTWGGTMLGITTATPDPDLAFALALHLYADMEILEDNFRSTNILPADREAWARPAFQEARSYWSGQQIGLEFAALADDLPVQLGHPYLQMAKAQVGNVISAAVSQWRRQQSSEGIEEFVRERLRARAAYVRLHVARMPDWDDPADAPKEGAPR